MTAPGHSPVEALSDIDLVLVGGEVIDGTGSPAFQADVAVAAGRIVAIGSFDEQFDGQLGPDVERFDVTGRLVCPGFVDAHGHSDLAILSAPAAPSKVMQGVTTEVMGNCGVAVAPVGPDVDVRELRDTLALIDVDAAVDWSWRSVAEYLDRVDNARPSMNVALLAGHLAIRVSCVGYEDRPATDAELARMTEMLDAALREGACGLATGLMYPPASFADLRELVALGHVVARHDAVFTFHMRSYTQHLLEAVEEAIEVARQTGAKVQLSHLVAVGRPNWGKVEQAIAIVDAACEEGLDIAFDVYPYLAGSTGLTQMLPDWSLEGGTQALLARLADPDERQRIHREVTESMIQEPGDILVASGSFPDDVEVVGKSIGELGEQWGTGFIDTILQLVEMSHASVTIIAFGRSEEDLRAALASPRCLIGSDGLGLDPDGPSGAGQPHPRSYGCYPRLLGHFVREEAVLSLEEAIRRATSQVADRFGIPERGTVSVGAIADLVVFDPATIIDQATFTEPHRFPTGIDLVLVRGQPVVRQGQLTGERQGEVMRISHPA